MSDVLGSEPVAPPGEPTVAPPHDSTASEGAQPEGAGAEGERKSERLSDAIADLLQMAVNYLRQETAGIMRDKVVLPGQKLGAMVGFALAASFLFALGVGFLAVALLILLANYLTWPGALGAIGGVLVVGAAIFTSLKVRSMQR
jgi:hypothetical protein